MAEYSKLRTQAETSFRKLQTQSSAPGRVVTDADAAAHARDANTVRLRELRLNKEALDREASARAPAGPRRKTIGC